MKTPLIEAIKNGDLPLVRTLIQSGADVNEEDPGNGFRALNYALPRDNSLFMVLVGAGADINYTFGISQTLLTEAIDLQNLDIIKYLVEHGTDINLRRRPHGHTPLYQAVLKPSLEIVEYLVDHGARIDLVSESKETILNYAIINGPPGNLRLIRYFVENLHMDINTQDKYGKTPLHNAIERGNIDYVKYLVGHGARLDIPDRNGMTPWNLGLKFHNNKSNQHIHLYKNINPLVIDYFQKLALQTQFHLKRYIIGKNVQLNPENSIPLLPDDVLEKIKHNVFPSFGKSRKSRLKKDLKILQNIK